MMVAVLLQGQPPLQPHQAVRRGKQPNGTGSVLESSAQERRLSVDMQDDSYCGATNGTVLIADQSGAETLQVITPTPKACQAK